MQAVMLAAGMGKRLGKYTKNNTKCMLEIQGKTLIERAIEALLESGVDKIIIVVGYKGENLKKFLLEECQNPKLKDMKIEFVDNDIYDKTNNIYSLYLAKEYLKQDDTILLESDLIYDYDLIKKLVNSDKPNLVSVAKYKQWMDGTVIKIGNEDKIEEFIEKKDFNYKDIDNYYKTVNIYKFSKNFSENQIIPFLEAYMKAYGKNEYYELILKIIAHLSRSDLKALDIGDLDWYEIDDAQDFDIANTIFSKGYERLVNFQKKYGGYWRYENILDYCYLVNPYYPPKKMLDKLNYFSHELLTSYPSGQYIQTINAERLIGDIDSNHLIVGNGAAELINILGRVLKGKMYVSKSVFNEYVRCFTNCEFNIYDESKNNFKFNLDEIENNIVNNDIICIVNPDNPSGAFIEYNDIINLIEKCNKENKLIIVDESFIDFASKDKKYTLLKNDIIEKYKNLVVVKSISKSYGVPGIRLGILATSNEILKEKIKNFLPVWNINSYAEYFLQIANLYKSDYLASCEKIATERERFIKSLRNLNVINVYDSEANYVLVNLGDINSTKVAKDLIDENIFIKDLRTKAAFKDQNFIRLAIRTEEENKKLVKKLESKLRG